MSIRVAFVIDTIESPTAGTESQLLRLIQGLDRERIEPVLCCLRPSRWLLEQWRGCRVHLAGIYSVKTFSGLIGIARLALWLKANRIDVVQTHFRDGSLAGILAAWLARVRIIVGTRRGRPLTKGHLDSFLFRVINRIPDRFIANSRFSLELAKLAEGIPEAKLRVIPNALDMNAFPALTTEARLTARRALGLYERDETPVAGIVANLNAWKRQDLLIQAAAILAKGGSPIRVVLIGGGDQEGLRTLAKSLGVSDRVFFPGSRENIPALLPAFDIGVLCSDFESSSNALIEYLAAGLPVVCTRVGGLPETMEEGVSGMVIPPGDAQALASALESMLRNRPDPREFQRFRTALFERHSYQGMVAGHLSAYELEGAGL